MPEPDIPQVSSGQVIASSWGNTVRTKVQDTTDGHRHDGVGSRMLEGTKIKDIDATPVDNMLLKVLDAILYLRSSADDANRQIAEACIPNLSASKITSGVFELARIPTMDDAHIPNVETLSYGGAFATAQIPSLDAGKITSGRFGLARLPEGALNYVLKGQGVGADPAYGQVAHGELTGVTSDQHHAQLHKASHESGGGDALTALDASIITTGILAAARGGLAKGLVPTWTNDYILVYKTATDDWRMETKGAPSAHGDTHEDGGTDELDAALDERAYPMKAGLIANRPAAGITGRFYWSTDEHILYRDNGTSWDKVAVADHPDLDGVTADQHHAQLHASAHVVGAGDPLSVGVPVNVGTANAEGTATNFARRDHVHAHPSGLGTDLHHAQLHKDAHKSGGGDAFLVSDLLDAIARIKVRKNTGASDVGSRRRLNLIEGSNITLTVEDDSVNEEVDVTIAAAAGAADDPSSVWQFWEDFQGGVNDVFDYGWSEATLVGTGGSFGAYEIAGKYGCARLAAPATATYGMGAQWGVAGSRVPYAAGMDFKMYAVVNQIAAIKVKIGLGSDWGADPPANAVYFEFESAVSANWKAVCKSGANITSVDTLVAADTSWHVFRTKYVSLAAGVEFYIDGVLKATITTNIPNNAQVRGGGQIFTTEAVAKNMDWDYMWARKEGLSR